MRILILATMIVHATQQTAPCDEPDVSADAGAPITTHSVISAHRDVAAGKLAVARTKRDLAEHRLSRIDRLHRLGHASWMEQSQAQLDAQAAAASLESQQELVTWLDAQTELAENTDRMIDSVTLLVKLPESQVPIAWQTCLNFDDSLDGLLLHSSQPSDLQRALLREHRLTKTLETLRRSTHPDQTAIQFTELEYQAAAADLKLHQSQRALDERNRRALQNLQGNLTNAEVAAQWRSAKSDSNHHDVYDDHDLRETLISLISEESAISNSQELSTVLAWSQNNAESARVLQQKGLVSVRELTARRREGGRIASAISNQAALSEWKREWLARHSVLTRHSHRFVEVAEPHSLTTDVLPDLSEITDLALLEFYVDTVATYIDLIHQQQVAKCRMEFSRELQTRLQRQSNASAAEIDNARRLHSLYEVQAQVVTQRAEFAQRLVSILPALTLSLAQTDSVQLLDGEVRDALSRFEVYQASQAVSSIAGINEAIKSLRRRHVVLEELRQDGLASATEVSSITDQLLQLESEKTRFGQLQSHHTLRQKLLLDQQQRNEQQP